MKQTLSISQLFSLSSSPHPTKRNIAEQREDDEMETKKKWEKLKKG
jgi:hypothetical protein